MIPEREIIERHFARRVGRFLEFGACDGVQNSLTVGLVEAGWQAVRVEPEPLTFTRLLANCADNPRLNLVNAAVYPEPGLHRFWGQRDGGEVSTLKEAFTTQWEKNGVRYWPPYWIPTITPKMLMGMFGGPMGWNFCLVDVEGVNQPVVEAIPWSDMRDTELICIEFDSSPKPIIAFLERWYACECVGTCNVIGRRRGNCR